MAQSRKSRNSHAETGTSPKKGDALVWWNCKGVFHWELLHASTNVTSDVYCRQLDRVEAALRGRQDKVFFIHDNARLHVARETRKKLQCFGWHVLAHPPCSPAVTSTDCHLFPSLSNHLRKKQFDEGSKLKSAPEFFHRKSCNAIEAGSANYQNFNRGVS